jgi:anti-anti-sigma factor
MDITARRTGEQLVLSLTGRMDGTGAQQAASAIQQHLNDHDTAVIFDLGGVDYLSSAGLRVFQESIRKMKERNGKVAVCRLHEFTEKILGTGGFLPLLSVYPTVDAALADTKKRQSPAGREVSLAGSGWLLSAEHCADRSCTLSVTGDLRAIHDGRVSIGDVQINRGCSKGFCAGIGAMGKNRDMAAPLLGEMISIGGTVYWIPTDGHLTPDYFTAEDSGSSGMKSFSLFTIAFSGPFTDMIRISSEKPDGITLAEAYGGIFRYAAQQYPGYRGVCAVVMKATIGGVYSSDMKTSLLAAAADHAARGPAAMPGGRTVTELPFDGSISERVSEINVKPRYAGDVLISVGYGIDLKVAQNAFPADELAALYYTDPRRSADGMFLYNKGAVFRNLRWDNSAGFEAQADSVLDAGEFVAMHNLLGITKIKSALAGIVPVAQIKTEK